MKSTYEIIVTKKIIIETFVGSFTIDSYKELKNREFKDTKFNPAYSVIADLREIESLYNNKEAKLIADFLFDNKDKITNRKSALVTSTKQQVVGSMLFETYSNKLPINVKVFSTLEAALKWIEE